jgi:polar amino acid transport system substrate-binding protein
MSARRVVGLAVGVLAWAFSMPALAEPRVEDFRVRKLVVGTMRVPPFASRGDDGVWSA